MTRPARKAPLEGHAHGAAEAFLARTDGEEEWQKAERALTLHMLETHAPRFFQAAQLAPRLEAAMAALEGFPHEFEAGLDTEAAMGRLDALYLFHERGLGAPSADPAQLGAYVEGLQTSHGPLWAWVFSELGKAIGVASLPEVSPRACRGRSKLEDLYWLTHLVLFETRYLRRPLAARCLRAEVDELAQAAPWVIGDERLDLAAEVAFCLQAAGRRRAAAHRSLVALLARRQRPDGSLGEPRQLLESAQSALRREAHCTAAALVALAGAGG
jgi:D-amino peptidase